MKGVQLSSRQAIISFREIIHDETALLSRMFLGKTQMWLLP